ncbi:MAG TPA: cupin [Novosphingobium sp.]|nr:cupin [Novosphingobium sp.]HZV10376.1 cupin [Novosphingobium sp.]
MTHLAIYADQAPHAEIDSSADFGDISAVLAEAGIGLERWQAGAALGDAPADAAILAAYAPQVAALQARGGYRSVDVVRLTPDHPAAADMRAKFLAEHVHDDDEVRFFVEGAGLFYIRHGGQVLALECTAGDLIVLPAGTRHWFDTGAAPRFTAIRLFTTPEGWVARFTGDAIASAIPLYAGAAA